MISQESYHGIKKRVAPVIFSVAAEDWLKLKEPTLASKSLQIEKSNLKHLKPHFGQTLIRDINAHGIAQYQRHCLAKGAARKRST